MLLYPEVLALQILNLIMLFFAVIAFYLSLKIFLKWDFSSTSQSQYKLEKQSFLSATIIKYIFALKVPLFIFFIFTLDKISNVLPGAMCAAGVVDATQYGTYLLILKVLNLYIFAYWLVLNNEDMKYEDQPYTKLKFGVFLAAFFLLVSEIAVEWLMFNAIDTNKVVDCCGVIFSSSSGSYFSAIFAIKTPLLIGVFYTNFLAIAVFYFLKNRYLFALSNAFFIITSLVTLISFFGIYIYELPTHHCPFCFLQRDYDYVGYLLYILLFVGTFYGVVIGLIEFSKRDVKRYFNISLLFDLVYVLVVSGYPVFYYLKNGVWL